MKTKKIKCDCRYCTDGVRRRRTVRVRKARRAKVATIDILADNETLLGSQMEFSHYKLLRLQEAIGLVVLALNWCQPQRKVGNVRHFDFLTRRRSRETGIFYHRVFYK